MPHTPALPPLPDAPAPRLIDGLTILACLLIGYVYALRHGPRDSRLWSLLQGAACLLLLVVCPALVVPLAPRLFATPMLPSWLVAAVALGAVLSLVAMAGRFQVHGGARRAYMDPSRRSFLSVRATATGWNVENFFTFRPGTASAAPLWSNVVPALLAAADNEQVTITATAINTDLANYYIHRVPTFEKAADQPKSPRVELIRRPVPRQ